MKQDILAKLYQKEISPKQAEAIYKAIITSEAPKARVLLGMSRIEWTAFAQGADLETLSNWRYGGWPGLCLRCKREIVINKFGWFIHRGRVGKKRLEHISCIRSPKVSLAQNG